MAQENDSSIDKLDTNIEAMATKERSGFRRSPNWSIQEMQILCDFVREHKEQLFGFGSTETKKGVNAAKKKYWEIAASAINTKAGTNRHWSQARKKWKDLSYFARNCDKKDAESNGGGRSKQEATLTQEMEIPVELDSVASSDCVSNDAADVNHLNEPVLPSSFPLSDESEKDCLMVAKKLKQSLNSGASSMSFLNALEKEQKPLLSDYPFCQSNKLQKLKDVEQFCRACLRPFNFSVEECNANRLHRHRHKLCGIEKTIRQAEEEKLEIQRRTLQCLREISCGVRRIGVNLARLKRRNDLGTFRKSIKRPKRRDSFRVRWRTESESSEHDFA